MDPAVPRPDTIQALRWGADAAFAMLAGMQLDLFTALQDGAQTPSQLPECQHCRRSFREEVAEDRPRPVPPKLQR